MEKSPNLLNTLSKTKRTAIAATAAGVAFLSVSCEGSSSSSTANSPSQDSEYDIKRNIFCNDTSTSIKLSVGQEALVKVLNGGTQGLEIDKKDNKTHYLDKHPNGVDQEDDIKLKNGDTKTILVNTTRFRISENQGKVVVWALCNKNSLNNPNKDKAKTRAPTAKEPKTDLNKDSKNDQQNSTKKKDSDTSTKDSSKSRSR